MVDEKLLINKKVPIREAIDRLVNGEKRVLFIVEGNDFLGIFTNGDMRKVLLSSTDLSSPIESVMNKNPIVFKCKKDAIDYSQNKELIVYPIVKDGVLIDALFIDDDIFKSNNYKELENVPLVMMAGGKGTRLYPFTKILPKALIPIGDYTIAERIINSFNRYGCKDVYMILNHKANMIKAYFNELNTDYNIFFEKEEKFLGTGGGLYLVKNKIKNTFIVTNCDILINDDLSCAYKTHKLNHNKITMVCSSKTFAIPYGVVKPNEAGEILEIEEKPNFNFLVNTGVYILEPEVLDCIKNNTFISLPDLVLQCQKNGMKVGIFPVGDKAWLDMGQFDSMNQMLEHFGSNDQINYNK